MRSSFFDFDEMLESTLDFGVLLPKKEKVSLSRKLDILREKLPVDASIDLHFFDEGSVLRGSLEIKTLNKKFSAISFGKSPESIYKELADEINQQVMKWKKTRFMKGVKFNRSMINNSHVILGGVG